MIRITIKTDNDAFVLSKRGEVARILADLSKRFEDGEYPGQVTDHNGNGVGVVKYTGKDKP